ncbi:MAG: tetratricopeptide repeat protein [Treponema sp.]|jgi:tetratricopeptide (TPR) repeat protein|nr:tetratricopeptide repeat protein [Treponema sp.]
MKPIGEVFLLWFLLAACSPRPVDEETLRLYAEASKAYGEHRYVDVIDTLDGKGDFVPALVLKGKAEYFEGKLEAAVKTLTRARRLSPGGTEAALFLARTLRDQGKGTEAQAIVDEVLRDDPNDMRALRFSALLAGERGPAGEAAKAALLDRAAGAAGEAALVFLDRAKLRWTGGRGLEALEDLRKAKAILRGSDSGSDGHGTPGIIASIERLEQTIRERMY